MKVAARIAILKRHRTAVIARIEDIEMLLSTQNLTEGEKRLSLDEYKKWRTNALETLTKHKRELRRLNADIRAHVDLEREENDLADMKHVADALAVALNQPLAKQQIAGCRLVLVRVREHLNRSPGARKVSKRVKERIGAVAKKD